MILGMGVTEAQEQLRKQLRAIRLEQGLTQKGLAERSGVPLPTLRKYEQQGLISLESFLKILMVLGKLEALLDTLEGDEKEHFNSIDDVLKGRPRKDRKYGWRA